MVKVFLDLDGVIVDFVSGACKLHGRPVPYPENNGNHDLPALLGMSNTNFFKGMEHDFWVSLSPLPDGFEILNVVESIVGIDNICILSTPSLNYGSASGKAEWLARHVPRYKRRYLLGPQKEFCAHSGAILIDDYDVNIIKFGNAGGHTILVPRPWNSQHAFVNSRVKTGPTWDMSGIANHVGLALGTIIDRIKFARTI